MQSSPTAVRQGMAVLLLAALVLLLLSFVRRARLERADFVLNNGAEVQTLDPATVTGVPEGRVVRALFEGLTLKHPVTLEPLPGMATAWELSADQRTYTFHLREDAFWTVPGTDPARFPERGRAFVADDFVYSWERLLHPETAAEYAYQLWYVRGAKAYTLTPPGLFDAEPTSPLWLSELPDAPGTWQLGATLWERPREAAREARLELLVQAGQAFERGAPLLAIGAGPSAEALTLAAPVAGSVTRVNPSRPATPGALFDAPGTWLFEARIAGAELDAARASGALEDEAAARARLFAAHVGIRAPDAHTLVVELEEPTPFFMGLTGFYPLFPVNRENLETAKERWPDTWRVEWIKPENLVVNGPYRVLERRVNDRIRLVKNPVYWDADAVAMRTIDILAVESYQTMLNMYLTGEIDMIDRVATNLVPELMRREDFRPEPYLGTYFYRVNSTRPPLDDPHVRRALALTIDRRAIVEKILKAGQLPNWGLCPSGMEPYPRVDMVHTKIRDDLSDYDAAFAADISIARGLLREAGFGEGGATLRTLEIHYNTSEAHRDIAEVIADSWRRHLGLEVELLNQEWKVYLDTQASLEYDVSRSAWIGDYADPNTFLDLFVTGGENNKTGWGDSDYDALIREAQRTADPAQRFQVLARAERLLVDALPILPIYTYTTQNVVRPRLGGYAENLQDDHFPKHFYWMDDAELAAARAARAVQLAEVEPGGPPAGLYPPKGRNAVIPGSEH